MLEAPESFLSTAYERGMLASSAGESRDANPYGPGSEQHAAWDLGWRGEQEISRWKQSDQYAVEELNHELPGWEKCETLGANQQARSVRRAVEHVRAALGFRPHCQFLLDYARWMLRTRVDALLGLGPPSDPDWTPPWEGESGI